MKRTVLINLLCSFITVLVVALGIAFAIMFNSSDLFTKPELVISSESATAIYDGKPLTNSKWHLVSGELKDGHKLSVEVKGVQTDVGISENYVVAKVLDEDGKDVTDKYDIEYRPGVLNVKARNIAIIAGSDSKAYDGTPLTCDKYETEPAGDLALANGHSLSVTVSGSITEVGEEDNVITSAIITTAAGVDVTKNYNITTAKGTLIIYEPDIADPDPNPDPDPDPQPGDGGDTGNNNGGSTGDSGNNNNGGGGGTGDSGNGGTGTGTGGDGNGTGGSGTDNGGGGGGTDGDGNGGNGNGSDGFGDGGDGTGNGSIGGGGGEIQEEIVFTVLANHSGLLYLKMRSYGDYRKENASFADVGAYEYFMNGAYSAYYLVPYALDNSGLTVKNAIITPKKGIYALPYYTINGAIQTTDVHIDGHAKEPYAVSYFYWQGTSGANLPSKYTQFEAAYAEYVRNTYLNLDEETLEFMMGLIAEQNLSASDKDIINKVATYIKQAADYNLNYDLELDESENIIIDFLVKYQEGVCRHYAAAATALFRALGIPARYTVGYVANARENETVKVTTKQAHAWVEVYVDGLGWVNVEVTGSSNQDDQPIILNIKPTTTRESYEEGKTVYAKNSVTGFTITSGGYRYEATVEGSISGLGTATSVITEFKIYSSDDILVYRKSTGLGSDKFIITYGDGIVQQYISHVVFQSDDRQKTYDGTGISTTVEDCWLVSGSMCESLGYSCRITPTGVINKAGTKAATFVVKFYKDGVDCTSHFWVEYVYGTLTLTAKEITISAQSDEKEYDGSALTCNQIVYDASLLAAGDTIVEYTVQGTQTNIGSSSNVLKSVRIENSKGEDVTDNYMITIRDGVLTVTVPSD